MPEVYEFPSKTPVDVLDNILGDARYLKLDQTNPQAIINGIYFGDPTVDGSWRIFPSGNNLMMQRRESGSWETKSEVTP